MAYKKKAKEEMSESVNTQAETSNREEDNRGEATVSYTPEEKVDEVQKERKPMLHVLADDRLNNLINRANELGITDVVQILSSEKYGFYLVYKD